MTGDHPDLAEKILAIHDALDRGGVTHAFGGALALAWCTRQARGTIDVDVNVFVAPNRAGEILKLLPSAVTITDRDRRLLGRDGQTRLWWGTTPLDIFLSTTDFHDGVADRVRFEPFGGASVPFLACTDLAIFKAFFNRTKDWADLEAMLEGGSLDVVAVTAVLGPLLGPDDERIARLRSL